MPITRSESGLTAAQFTEIQNLHETPAYSIVAERYNLSFKLRKNMLRSFAGTDAEVSGSYLVRAYFIDTSLHVERTQSDASTWTTTLTTAASYLVPPTLAVSGNTVRVFYYTGTDIAYKESADNGATWGAEQTVDTVANVKFLAAVSTTKVHYTTLTTPNYRFHYAEFSGGWSSTDSLIYWPHEPTGFDAITVDSKDLLVVSTFLQSRYDDTRQGLVGLFQANGRWSEHFDIDVIDEGADWRYRRYPKLSHNGGYYLLTFYGSDGTEDNPIADRAVTRSKDGRWWEKRTFCACSEDGHASLLVMGAFAYMVGISNSYISDATRYVGYTPSTGDGAYFGEISGDVIRNFGSEMSTMRQTNFIISDEAGVYSAGMFSANNVILLSYRIGYQSAGMACELTIPYSLEEIDFHKIVTRLSFTGIQISSRDHMAWLTDNTRAADHTREWESQLLGRDRFKDETETGYGGMRHTACDGGHWPHIKGIREDRPVH